MVLDYSTDELIAVIKRVLDGEKGRTVSLDTKIPYHTLMKWVTQRKHGIVRTLRRRASSLRLTPEAEAHLFGWIIGPQHVGHPAWRHEIIYKASIISAQTTGETVGGG